MAPPHRRRPLPHAPGPRLPRRLLTYRKYIEWETGRKAEWRDGVARIGGVKTPAYTFRENYCFAAGDHAIDSQDSRYWGLLPEKFIVGVAQFVWKSGVGIRKVRK